MYLYVDSRCTPCRSRTLSHFSHHAIATFTFICSVYIWIKRCMSRVVCVSNPVIEHNKLSKRISWLPIIQPFGLISTKFHQENCIFQKRKQKTKAKKIQIKIIADLNSTISLHQFTRWKRHKFINVTDFSWKIAKINQILRYRIYSAVIGHKKKTTEKFKVHSKATLVF